MLRIAIDVMGGEHGPSVTVPGCAAVLEQHSGLELLLSGDGESIRQQLDLLPPALSRRCTIRHTPAVFADTERPERILRHGRDSSLYQAVLAVADREADACVSSGNTGALLLVSRHLLEMLPGVDKPALVAAIPVFSGHRRTLLLDVGATLECSGEQLYQFGIMGAVLLSSLEQLRRPKVALLNIGTEEYKGHRQIQQAATLFGQAPDTLEYTGFVEANRVFAGEADVLVCDGFSGNVTIKASAGAAGAVNRMIRHAVQRHPVRAALSGPIFREIHDQADPSRYNGASLLGLSGIVVKSHGHSDANGFAYAVRHAVREASQDVPRVIAREIGRVIRTSTRE